MSRLSPPPIPRVPVPVTCPHPSSDRPCRPEPPRPSVFLGLLCKPRPPGFSFHLQACSWRASAVPTPVAPSLPFPQLPSRSLESLPRCPGEDRAGASVLATRRGCPALEDTSEVELSETFRAPAQLAVPRLFHRGVCSGVSAVLSTFSFPDATPAPGNCPPPISGVSISSARNAPSDALTR